MADQKTSWKLTYWSWKFSPSHVYVGVYWWYSPIGMSLDQVTGFQFSLVLALVPFFPIQLILVRDA